MKDIRHLITFLFASYHLGTVGLVGVTTARL